MATWLPPTDVSGNTGTEPAGATNGDTLVAIAYASGSTIPSLATGWTSIAAVATTNWAIGIRIAKIQRGASAPSYLFTNAARVIVYGMHGSIVFANVAAGVGDNASSANPTSPPALGASGVDGIVVFVTLNFATITDPSNFNSDFNTSGHATGSALFGVVGGGPYTWTLGTAQASVTASIRFAVAPPISGGSLPLLGVG